MINFKRIIATCLAGIIVLTLHSCKNYENENLIFGTEIVAINYGTSFGMCAGYCKNELKISIGIKTLKSSGWNSSVTPKTYSDVISAENWEKITSEIKTDEFFKLPIVYGCPDCADGGAEWVEIELKSGETHKVTYEYMKEPDELKSLVSVLRIHFDEMLNASK